MYRRTMLFSRGIIIIDPASEWIVHFIWNTVSI